MNFEERLERLAERHEALTQSVELLHRDVLALTAAGQQTTRNFEIVLDSIKSLERNRSSDLEGEN
jgi:prefoldin subunit 5